MADLDRVVAEELRAYQPEDVPSLADVLARRRQRTRRRAVGLAGLSVVAVLVIAVGPSLVTSMDRGSTTASSPETTASFVASCLGAETSVPLLPDLVGRPESALADLAAGTPVRVLGRDGECVPARTADLNPNRINVIITAGTIVWAAHF